MHFTQIFVSTFVVVYVFFTPHAMAASTENVTDTMSSKIDALTSYIARLHVERKPLPWQSLSHNTLRDAVENGVSWLINAQEESGHFAYEYLPFEDRYRADDNIVRQAGALYALGEVAKKSTKKNETMDTAIEKAIGYFEKLSPVHTYNDTEVRCVTKNEKSKVCKLGATSLALIGILDYVEAEPKKAPAYKSLIDGYVAFIMSAKIEGAGFHDHYKIGTGFKENIESPFSNGEALLALVRYYQYEEKSITKKLIDDTYAYLEKQPFDANLYLWMMASLKDLHALSPQDTYTSYGRAFTFWRLERLKLSHGSVHNNCPAIEGLASAYTLLEEKLTPQEKKMLSSEINFWNSKNIGLQLDQENVFRVSPVDGVLALRKTMNQKKSAGGFLTGELEPTQRIDFTQHCVNTYLQTLVDIEKGSL